MRVSNDQVRVLLRALALYETYLYDDTNGARTREEQVQWDHNRAAMEKSMRKLASIWDFRTDLRTEREAVKHRLRGLAKLRFRDFIGAIVGFILGGAAYIWWPW